MEDFFMRSIWKKIGLALITLTVTSQAHALILIEPYGGYNLSVGGDSNFFSGTTKEDISFDGFGYGLRLGLNITSIMFGVGYDQMTLSTDFKGTTTKEYDNDQKNLGAFVGWNPKDRGFRIFGEYFWEVKNKVDVNGTDTNFDGSGWGIGVGWKFMNWLALNAEYRAWTTDEQSWDLDGNSVFVTLSLPFDIL